MMCNTCFKGNVSCVWSWIFVEPVFSPCLRLTHGWVAGETCWHLLSLTDGRRGNARQLEPARWVRVWMWEFWGVSGRTVLEISSSASELSWYHEVEAQGETWLGCLLHIGFNTIFSSFISVLFLPWRNLNHRYSKWIWRSLEVQIAGDGKGISQRKWWYS